MCMQDIKIGRRSWHSETRVPTASTLTELCQTNQYRTALVFSGTQNNDFFLTTNPKNGGGVGLSFPLNAQPFSLDIQHHGGLVTCAWYVVQGSGNDTITVMESFFDADTEV